MFLLHIQQLRLYTLLNFLQSQLKCFVYVCNSLRHLESKISGHYFL